MVKTCWQGFTNDEVWKTLIQLNPPSDKWWSRGPDRTLPVGLVGDLKLQEWREPSSSNLIWPRILVLNHFHISKAPSVFYSLIPFYPSPIGQMYQGLFLLFFRWANGSPEMGWACHHLASCGRTRVRGFPGHPAVCVGQGWVGSQFLWWNPPTNGRKSAGWKQGSLLAGLHLGAVWTVHPDATPSTSGKLLLSKRAADVPLACLLSSMWMDYISSEKCPLYDHC